MSTSSEIARTEPAGSAALVTREYLEAKRDLVRSLYAPDATDLEFEHFIETCVLRGLNPLAKQAYCISRYDKKQGRKVATIQTGIDGFRVIAQRTGQYRGQVGPLWCGPDGEWREVWLEDGPPAAAKVGIIRDGFAEPVWGVARWASYAQEGQFWQRMGDVMLAKCAEALALRKAFPEDLSGLVTDDEMHQAGPAVRHDWRRRWSEAQALASDRGLDPDALKAVAKGVGVGRPSDLDDDDRFAALMQALDGDTIDGEAEDITGETPAEQLGFEGGDEPQHRDPVDA